MSELIWILINSMFVVLSLGAGVGSVLLAVRLYNRYNFNYLNSFMYYQILMFIFGLYGLLGTLFVRNVLIDYNIPPSTLKNIAEFIPYLGVPVIITAWFLFLKMSFELTKKRLSQSGSFIYFGSVVAAMTVYIYLIFIYFGKSSSTAEVLISYSKFGFITLELFTLSVAFLVLFGYGATVKHKQKRETILKFASISLVVNILTLTAFILSVPNTIMEKIYMLLFFAGQLPPAVLLTFLLNKYSEDKTDNNDKQQSINNFIRNYQLSKREWEIVEKICEGYTNGQIGEKLFISLQTVKDHVYHIYKKTGVKNRVQLVNMVLSHEKK